MRNKNYKTIIQFDLGQKIYLDLKDWLQSQLFWMKIYYIERKETEYFKRILKRGDIVVDVGAHIGYYTLISGARVGKEGHVYSFEPNPETFKRLKRNVQLNNLNNISLYNIGLSDKEEFLTLNLPTSINTGTAGITIPENFSGKSLKVKAIPLDKFIEKNNIKKVDIIKIDVEGAEIKVLKGMMETIRKFKPKIFIEINNKKLKAAGFSKEEVYNLLKKENYKAFQIVNKDKIEPLSEIIEGNLILFQPF